MMGKKGSTGRSTRRRSLGPLVLVVDDFPDAREMYAEVLTLAGFRVDQAENGVIAVEKAKALSPAAIVMDLSLPIMDGWQATREIRENPATREVRIVAISAHSLPTHVARAKESGADAFLAKPCLPDELIDTLRRLLEAPEKKKAVTER